MVELAIHGKPGFVCSRVELDRGGPSYTMDTVRELQKEPADAQAQWFFLIGSDAAGQLPEWNRIEALLERVQFSVVARPGQAAALSVPFSEKLKSVTVDTDPISSSEIRERIQAGQPIDEWVPPAVEQYIREKGLYRKGGAGQVWNCNYFFCLF